MARRLWAVRGGEGESVMGDVHLFRGKAEKPAKLACSICGKRSDIDHRPFCSARCKQVDLGRWLGGDYRLPTEEVAEPEEVIAALGAGEDQAPDR